MSISSTPNSDPTIPAVRLTSKTANDIRNDLVSRIPTITDKWTNFNESELGMVLLTILSGMLETLSFELNFRAGETTRTHVRLRPDGVRLFSLIGYQFKRKAPARTTLRISLAAPATRSVYIWGYTDPNRVEAKTNGAKAIPFTVAETTVIPPGSTQALVTALQGVRAVETFSPTADPNQIFSLSGVDIGEGTLQIYVNSVPWTQVEHFVDSRPASRHVRVVTDEQLVTRLLFGDGVAGAIPVGPIEVIYLTTLGKAGKVVGKNRITSFSKSPTDVDGDVPLDLNNNPVPMAVTNTEDATGGDDEEDLWKAKKQAPRQYAAQRRAVTHDDYVAWAEGFPGVRQAAAIDIRDVGVSTFDIDYHQIKIPIIPTDGVRPSAALKRDLQRHFERLKTVPDDVEVIDPTYVPVSIQVDFVLRKTYENQSSVVKAAVISAIESFFDIATSPSEELKIGGEVEGMQFGTDVSFSRLLAAVQAVPGVYSISELAISNLETGKDLTVHPYEIAILDVGSPIVNIVGVS